MTDLSEKTALVTGSTQGIGLAIAEAFAAAGARLAVHGLAGDAEINDLLQHLETLGAPEAEFFHGNLRDGRQAADLIAAVNAWGGTDILVNNAGIQHPAPIADVPKDVWDAIIAVNLSAAFHTMQGALPVMEQRGFGRIINISSVQGLVASVDKAPYVSAKHGIIGLSQVAALEYASKGDPVQGGITVNCICPGWTETPLIGPQIDARAQIIGASRDVAIADLLTEKQPSLRMSQPAEIAALALWLCDPIAHNVTGTAIPVDGGWTAQ